MKFLIRWTFRLLILFVVLAVAAVLLLDTAAKSLMEGRIRSQTGMDVKIGKVEIGLASPTLRMDGFKLYNSSAFGGTSLMEIPELYVEYDREAVAQKKLKLKLLRVHVSEITVVRDAKGRTNLDALQSQGGRAQQVGMEFVGIETLNLTLGKLRYIDLKDPKQTKEVSCGLKEEVVHNVKSAGDLSGVMLKVALKQGAGLLGGGWLNALLPSLGMSPTNQPGNQPPPRK